MNNTNIELANAPYSKERHTFEPFPGRENGRGQECSVIITVTKKPGQGFMTAQEFAICEEYVQSIKKYNQVALGALKTGADLKTQFEQVINESSQIKKRIPNISTNIRYKPINLAPQAAAVSSPVSTFIDKLKFWK